MSESFVIRLASRSAQTGELAGELEVVKSGRHVLFGSDEELLELLRTGGLGHAHGAGETQEGDAAGDTS